MRAPLRVLGVLCLASASLGAGAGCAVRAAAGPTTDFARHVGFQATLSGAASIELGDVGALEVNIRGGGGVSASQHGGEIVDDIGIDYGYYAEKSPLGVRIGPRFGARLPFAEGTCKGLLFGAELDVPVRLLPTERDTGKLELRVGPELSAAYDTCHVGPDVDRIPGRGYFGVEVEVANLMRF